MLISRPVDTAYYYTHTVHCSIAVKSAPGIIVWATTISNLCLCY